MTLDQLRSAAEAADRAGLYADAAAAWMGVGARLAIRHHHEAAAVYERATVAFLRADAVTSGLEAANLCLEMAERASYRRRVGRALRIRSLARTRAGDLLGAVADLHDAVARAAGGRSERKVSRARLGMALWHVGAHEGALRELDAAIRSTEKPAWLAEEARRWVEFRDRAARELAWMRERGGVALATSVWAVAGGRRTDWYLDGQRLSWRLVDPRRHAWIHEPTPEDEGFLVAFAAASGQPLPPPAPGVRGRLRAFFAPMDVIDGAVGPAQWTKAELTDVQGCLHLHRLTSAHGSTRVTVEDHVVPDLALALQDGHPVPDLPVELPHHRPGWAVLVGEGLVEVGGAREPVWRGPAGARPLTWPEELRAVSGNPWADQLLLRGPDRLEILGLATGATTPIAWDGAASACWWDPAGRWLAVRDHRGRRTAVVEVASGAVVAEPDACPYAWDGDGLLLIDGGPDAVVRWTPAGLTPAGWPGLRSPDGRWRLDEHGVVHPPSGACWPLDPVAAACAEPSRVAYFHARHGRSWWCGPHHLVLRRFPERHLRVLDLETKGERLLFADPELELIDAHPSGRLALARSYDHDCVIATV